MTRRTRIHIGVGDLLETFGAGLACYAVDRLAGLAWCLLLAAAILVVAGNLVYGQHRLTVGLPNRNDLARARFLAGRPYRALAHRGRTAGTALTARFSR